MATTPTTPAGQPQGYAFADAEACRSHGYLLGGLQKELGRRALSPEKKRLFDLGCGNGAVSAELTKNGYQVMGVDPSEKGIHQANARYPGLELRLSGCNGR